MMYRPIDKNMNAKEYKAFALIFSPEFLPCIVWKPKPYIGLNERCFQNVSYCISSEGNG